MTRVSRLACLFVLLASGVAMAQTDPSPPPAPPAQTEPSPPPAPPSSEPASPAPAPNPAPGTPAPSEPAPATPPATAPTFKLALETARTLTDRVEVGLRFEGMGTLELAITERTCPASITPAKLEAPARATLSLVPKGHGPCAVTLSVSDGQNQIAYRLRLEAPGEAGFNVVLQGGGSYGAANGLGADGSVTVSGGWGDLHLEAYAYTSLDVFVDGRFKIRYFGSSLELADSLGSPGTTAGNAGRGLYAQQDFGLWNDLGLSVGLGVPVGLPARAGIGFTTPYLCGNGSFNFLGTDAIFFLQGGYGGFYARAQYRPKAPSFLEYALEYASAPDFHVNLGGTEKNAFLEVSGFIAEASLLYRARADKDFTGPSWSTNGNLLTPYLGFGWTYTPGAAQLDADTFFGAGDPWDFSLGASIGKTIGVAARAGLRYRESLDGPLTVGFGLSAQTVAFPDSLSANLKVVYANVSGWQLSAEVQTPILHPDQTNLKLGVSTLFFVPVEAPAPTATLEPIASPGPSAPPSPLGPEVQPGACR